MFRPNRRRERGAPGIKTGPPYRPANTCEIAWFLDASACTNFGILTFILAQRSILWI
jgi:hypothetical protein